MVIICILGCEKRSECTVSEKFCGNAVLDNTRHVHEI